MQETMNNNYGAEEKVLVTAIDHGFGNMKTVNTCFKTGVVAYDAEPTFKNNLLVYQGRYFKIGEGHKEFIADKIQDEDYYILTLAAIAREMNIRKVYSAKVHIAAGLPLTWVREQRESFRKYLLQNEAADFSFNGRDYHVQFVGADVFPQGFAAVANRLGEFSGVNMLADIGNGTMNVMYINDRMPQEQKCYTEKFGVNQCMLAAKENLMKQFGVAADESVIEKVFRFGTAEISERFLASIRQTATAYVQGIFRKLREHEYNPALMRLFVVGGGACLIRNFSEYDPKRVIINDDVCAAAKGYEMMAKRKLTKAGIAVW